MARKHTPLAICYDFDGTLSPGYMQNYTFIPDLGIATKEFWAKVKELAKEQQGDEILIYMGHMLREANNKEKSVSRSAIENCGKNVELFDGVEEWFNRINEYGKSKGIAVSHFIISSGLREMIKGTKISKYFSEIFASGFWYDHDNIARYPAIAVNYTNKTQFLFRINKGSHDVWDKDKINSYIHHDDRPVPFKNIVFIGDGETDIPCFRLVKDHGGHSIAVYQPNKRKGGRASAEKLLTQGRVNFVVPANYNTDTQVDLAIKAIIDKISADAELKRLGMKL